MKFNIAHLLLLTFVSAWIIMEAFGASSHSYKIGISTACTIMAAYLNDLHGIIWRKICDLYD